MLIFHTNRLNKRLYRNATWNILLHLDQSGKDFLKKWDIHLWCLEKTNVKFFEHVLSTSGGKINPKMPSGVTGKYRIDLYLHDKISPLHTLENLDRLQHEICHAVLYKTPHFVKGVHDNVSNRFKIKFWYWKKFFWASTQISIIDIRKFL